MAEPNANPAVEPNGLKFATRDLPTLQAVQDLQESDVVPAPLRPEPASKGEQTLQLAF